MGTIRIKTKDVVWSYIGNFFRVATNIILLPLILKFLSTDEIGLWYVFASIGQIVVLLDFGFAATLSRNISYVWCGADCLEKENVRVVENKQTNWNSFKVILKTCQYIYVVISVIAFLLLAVVGTPYIISISGKDFLLAWGIYGVAVCVNLLYSYYTSFLCGVGAIAENNFAGIASKICQIVLSFVLLQCGMGLLGVSIAYLVSGFALRFVSFFCFYKYEGIGKSLRNVHVSGIYRQAFDMFMVIWHNASKDGLVTMSNFLSTQANTLICSYVMGLSVTGSFGLSIQLATIIGTIASIIFASFHPAMQEAALHNDRQAGYKYLNTSMMAYVYMYIIMSLGALAFLPVIHYLKPELEMDAVVFIVILVYMFIYYVYHLFSSCISTFNRLPYTTSFVVTAFASVILSFLLAKYTEMGIWALIIAPIVTSLVYNAWKWPYHVIYELCGSNINDFMVQGTRNLGSYIAERYLNQRNTRL